MLTDRDIVIEAVAPGLNPATLVAGDIMATPLSSVGVDDDVLDALARMRETGARRMPVLANDGALVGIVAIDDLLRVMAEQLGQIASVLGAETTREAMTRS